MDSKNMFRKYRKRLVAEGVAKSLIFGLLVGFAANIVIATVSCFVKVEGLWLISIGLLLVGTLISAPIFYFAKFRPTTKQIAARVDRRLGLEERTITMLELENDDSYIAMRQREDAKDALAATNKKMKSDVFTSAFMKPGLIAGLSVALVFSVTATSLAGFIANRPERIIPPSRYTISYGISDPIYPEKEEKPTTGVKSLSAKKTDEKPGTDSEQDNKKPLQGHIYGQTTQNVEEGKTTTTVVAVANEDWVFVGWSDGYSEEDRTDLAEGGDREILAIFEKKGVDSDDLSFGDGPGSGNGNGGNSSGDPSDGEGDGDGNGSGDGSGGGAGGQYTDPNDQVLDGKTDYKDVYEQYYKEAMEILANGGEIPASLRKIIEAYLNTLK